jgi:hypothetical protein
MRYAQVVKLLDERLEGHPQSRFQPARRGAPRPAAAAAAASVAAAVLCRRRERHCREARACNDIPRECMDTTEW